MEIAGSLAPVSRAHLQINPASLTKRYPGSGAQNAVQTRQGMCSNTSLFLLDRGMSQPLHYKSSPSLRPYITAETISWLQDTSKDDGAAPELLASGISTAIPCHVGAESLWKSCSSVSIGGGVRGSLHC